MGKVNVIIVDATGNKEQKVGLPDDIKCGIIMVKLVEKIKLPSVGPDGNPISYKFIHKVTGRQLLEAQTLGEAGIKDGDVLRLQPEITAGATFCSSCGNPEPDNASFCTKCGGKMGNQATENASAQNTAYNGYAAAGAAPAGATPAYNYAPAVTPKKKSKKGKLPSLLGVLSGILSIIFGFIVSGSYTGTWVSRESYGGDAYTGIQNAGAAAANNASAVAEILAVGLGFILIAFGLFMIFYFLTKMAAASNKD